MIASIFYELLLSRIYAYVRISAKIFHTLLDLFYNLRETHHTSTTRKNIQAYVRNLQEKAQNLLIINLYMSLEQHGAIYFLGEMRDALILLLESFQYSQKQDILI